MTFKINTQEFLISEILDLTQTSKLQAIVYLRSVANIGLKDAKDVIETLEQNPRSFEGKCLDFPTNNDVSFGKKPLVKANKPHDRREISKDNPFISKHNSPFWISILTFIFVIGISVLVYFQMN